MFPSNYLHRLLLCNSHFEIWFDATKHGWINRCNCYQQQLCHKAVNEILRYETSDSDMLTVLKIGHNLLVWVKVSFLTMIPLWQWLTWWQSWSRQTNYPSASEYQNHLLWNMTIVWSHKVPPTNTQHGKYNSGIEKKAVNLIYAASPQAVKPYTAK